MHQHYAGMSSRSADSSVTAQIFGAEASAGADYRSCWLALPLGIRSRIEQAASTTLSPTQALANHASANHASASHALPIHAAPGLALIAQPTNNLNPLAWAA